MKRREKENKAEEWSGQVNSRDWRKPSSFRDKKTFRKISSVARGLWWWECAKSHHSFTAFPSRLCFQIFKIHECNTSCLTSLGLNSSVAWGPLWFSGSPLSFHPPAKISRAFTALAAWVCDWSNSHSWPSKPHSLFQIWELEQPWLKLPGLRFSPLWLLFQSIFPSSWLPLAPHKWGCIYSLLKEDDGRIRVSNLLFLLNSVLVVPLLPPSSSPVEAHCELAQPKLQSHRCSQVSDPTQLQSPTGSRSLTSVSPSHRHPRCPGSPHPLEI